MEGTYNIMASRELQTKRQRIGDPRNFNIPQVTAVVTDAESQELHRLLHELKEDRCLTCKQRRKELCDAILPHCTNCAHGGFSCEKARPTEEASSP